MKRSSTARGHRNELPALARSAEILRYEGVAGFWFRLLALLGYRREAWYERPLRDPIPPPPRPRLAADMAASVPVGTSVSMPVSIEELGAEDAQAYVDFRPHATAELVRARFERGCRCFVARCDGRILAAIWTLEGAGWVEHLGRRLRLAPDEIYLFNGYTAPEARSRGLFAAIHATILEDGRRRGFRSSIGLIEPHNRPSILSFERLGYRRTGTIARLRFGPWRRELSWGRTDQQDRTDGDEFEPTARARLDRRGGGDAPAAD